MINSARFNPVVFDYQKRVARPVADRPPFQSLIRLEKCAAHLLSILCFAPCNHWEFQILYQDTLGKSINMKASNWNLSDIFFLLFCRRQCLLWICILPQAIFDDTFAISIIWWRRSQVWLTIPATAVSLETDLMMITWVSKLLDWRAALWRRQNIPSLVKRAVIILQLYIAPRVVAQLLSIL
jgi:hypothetical protein